jgi:predicted nucleic acid-binding protein
MTSYLIDINVWLALSLEHSPYAGSAQRWFGGLTGTRARLPFCRITELGLLRMLTNEAVMGESVLNIARP